MTMLRTGQIGPEPGQFCQTKREAPKKTQKLREKLAGMLQTALHASFAQWRGGSKALSAAVERDPRSAHRYLNGHTVMSAVDLLMLCLRCPHFVAELRERLHHAREDGGLLHSLTTKAIARAKRAGGKLGAMRLRFRRRKAVAP